MISDEDIERALDYLRDTAKPAAVARSQARILEKHLGVIEAKYKTHAIGMSNAAAQDAARASSEYQQGMDAWEEAMRRDAEFTMLREAADAKIRAWQTMSSNARAQVAV